MTEDPSPREAEFSPTHLVVLDELSQTEKDHYFDLMIESNAQFHRDYEKGEVIADMRILGPGVTMLTEEEEEKKRSDDGPRLTPQEKLAMKHGDESIKLPGAITTATGEVFNYTPYEGIIKLIKGKNDTTYKPKRRPLAWVMRLIHEILDIRYARDTSDLDEDDTFDETNPDDVARKAERDERTRQANVFPIFIIDLFSKKYGLKSLVESTTWDLLYSCDCLRNKGLCPDVDVFCLFIEMHYDADELLYYCYVRSLTQSVLNASFKTHWGDTGRIRDSQNVGIDRRPPTLTLNERECKYIAQTIFIRNQGDEIEHEKQMYADFMAKVKESVVDDEIDSSDFMQIAVERYYITRPDDEGEESPGEMTPTIDEEIEDEEGGDQGAFSYDHPLYNKIISGQSVESAEAEYLESIMGRDDFQGLHEEVLNEVRDDLTQELSQRIMQAEKDGSEKAETEAEFHEMIANAIKGFDTMTALVSEHVKQLKSGGAV